MPLRVSTWQLMSSPGTASLTATSTRIHPLPASSAPTAGRRARRRGRRRRPGRRPSGRLPSRWPSTRRPSSACSPRSSSAVGPMPRTRPLSSHIVVVHRRAIASMLWLTNSTVRPLRSTSSILPEAATLELDVADRQHLVDEQDLCLHVGGDGETEAQVHPRRVALDRRVHELLEAGEGDDLVEPGCAPRAWSSRGSPR